MSGERSLEGKVALVTGASRGIGAAIADVLGQRGARVLGTATGADGVEAIQKRLRQQNISGDALLLDLAEDASLAEFGQALARLEPAPAILVNNAGIVRDGLLPRLREEHWERVIRVNLGGAYRLCRLCLRGMLRARYGRIVNISSVVAHTGNPGQTNYVAAKAGIIGFTRSLAREVAGRGITVNAVAPGLIRSDMTASLSAERQTQSLRQIPMGRWGEPEEVAAAVAFLVSTDAAYITGETVNVNGGMSMN